MKHEFSISETNNTPWYHAIWDTSDPLQDPSTSISHSEIPPLLSEDAFSDELNSDIWNQFLPTSPELDFSLLDSKSHVLPPSTTTEFPDPLISCFERKDFVPLELDYAEEVIKVAECVDSNDPHLVPALLARLNRRLQFAPIGKPLHRAAFYFKEGLETLLTGPGSKIQTRPLSEIVQTIHAQNAFSGISPIPLFSHLAANQALFEALVGSASIHVIDFQIGLGDKWACFIRDIGAPRSQIRRCFLRISAIVPNEFAPESVLVGDSLTHFARECGVEFQIEFIPERNFDVLSFNAITLINGESTAVHLSPGVLVRRGLGLLVDLRLHSPRVVVLVDGDKWMEPGMASTFHRSFVSGLEFYSVMLESIDVRCGGDGDLRRNIEAFVVRPRIIAAVLAAAAEGGGKVVAWKEMMAAAGFRGFQLSRLAYFEAEFLVESAQVAGFHVARRHGEMLLCWHDRPMVGTSAWRC